MRCKIQLIFSLIVVLLFCSSCRNRIETDDGKSNITIAEEAGHSETRRDAVEMNTKQSEDILNKTRQELTSNDYLGAKIAIPIMSYDEAMRLQNSYFPEPLTKELLQTNDYENFFQKHQANNERMIQKEGGKITFEKSSGHTHADEVILERADKFYEGDIYFCDIDNNGQNELVVVVEKFQDEPDQLLSPVTTIEYWDFGSKRLLSFVGQKPQENMNDIILYGGKYFFCSIITSHDNERKGIELQRINHFRKETYAPTASFMKVEGESFTQVKYSYPNEYKEYQLIIDTQGDPLDSAYNEIRKKRQRDAYGEWMYPAQVAYYQVIGLTDKQVQSKLNKTMYQEITNTFYSGTYTDKGIEIRPFPLDDIDALSEYRQRVLTIRSYRRDDYAGEYYQSFDLLTGEALYLDDIIAVDDQFIEYIIEHVSHDKKWSEQYIRDSLQEASHPPDLFDYSDKGSAGLSDEGLYIVFNGEAFAETFPLLEIKQWLKISNERDVNSSKSAYNQQSVGKTLDPASFQNIETYPKETAKEIYFTLEGTRKMEILGNKEPTEADFVHRLYSAFQMLDTSYTESEEQVVQGLKDLSWLKSNQIALFIWQHDQCMADEPEAKQKWLDIFQTEVLAHWKNQEEKTFSLFLVEDI